MNHIILDYVYTLTKFLGYNYYYYELVMIILLCFCVSVHNLVLNLARLSNNLLQCESTSNN